MSISGKGVKLSLHVQPGAPRSEVAGMVAGVWRIRLAAPATQGKANRELIDFLSERLGIAKSRISIIKGHTSRNKIIAILGVSEEEIIKRLSGKD